MTSILKIRKTDLERLSISPGNMAELGCSCNCIWTHLIPKPGSESDGSGTQYFGDHLERLGGGHQISLYRYAQITGAVLGSLSEHS